MNAQAGFLNHVDQKAQPAMVALFVSDVHLSPALPETTHAFLEFLRNSARRSKQLYLLGDIFEYWAGDDDVSDPYHRRIVAALREVADAGTELFWIGGNRDFLVGASFAREAGMKLLPDPHVVELENQRMVLTHGDAWCTDDDAYMAFRRQVRDTEWQQQFLSQPLEQRKKIVEAMRMGSKEAQRGKPMEIMDVNEGEIAALFEASNARIMIHGHTHRPALHEMEFEGRECRRYVLPDWECEAKPERGGWLALAENGELVRFDVRGVRLT